jgi:hypothetical protein
VSNSGGRFYNAPFANASNGGAFDVKWKQSVTAGGTLGCNWQAMGSHFVYGAESETGFMRLHAGAINPYSVPNNGDTLDDTVIGNWFGALAGRAGFATDRALFYGKAGVGFTDVKEEVYKLPYNSWPTNRNEHRVGLWYHIALSEGHDNTGGYGMEAMSLAPLARIYQWPVDHVRQFISDDDQFQILIFLVFDQFTLQDGECLDQAVQVFVRTNLSRIENEWVFELIPLQDVFSFIGRVCERKTFVQRIVNNRDLGFRQIENIDQIFLS